MAPFYYIPLCRSLSDVQEAAQFLAGDSLFQIMVGALLSKSSVPEGADMNVINLTPYDCAVESVCKGGIDGHRVKTLSTSKNLQTCQFVEKALGVKLFEEHWVCF